MCAVVEVNYRVVVLFAVFILLADMKSAVLLMINLSRGRSCCRGEVSSWCWMVSLLVCITKDARSLTALQRERKQRRRQSLAISDVCRPTRARKNE